VRISVERQNKETAILVGLVTPRQSAFDAEDSLDELQELARTAGAVTVHREIQHRRPEPRYLIGKGKAEHVAALVEALEADLVVFDSDLTAAQVRNLEKLLGVKVIDRAELILDIFAQHAESREGKIQIELAQLNYLLPRLIGKGIEMSRLGGGIGTRGPGEKQLEYDRRRIRGRIARLDKDLSAVKRSRAEQRKKRKRDVAASIAIVGYTNAGKSSLLNALAAADAHVEEALFATLDPRIRRVTLPDGLEVVFSDTVGFIKKLPHTLVAAFRATLEEVVQADILLLVSDAGHPLMEQQIGTVKGVLAELGAAEKPIITVYNKRDKIEDAGLLERLERRGPDSVVISALHDKDFGRLLGLIMEKLRPLRREMTLAIPQDETHLIAEIHRHGEVFEQQYKDSVVVMTARVDRHLATKLEGYIKR
jgi:GTP-binding protein HflX